MTVSEAVVRLYSLKLCWLKSWFEVLNSLNGRPSHGSDERNWYLKCDFNFGNYLGILLENILLSGGLV